MNRGTGVSTEQIRKAPLNAIYVSPHTAALAYHKNLAAHLGRQDIQHITVQRIGRGWVRGKGPETLKLIVVDHSVWECRRSTCDSMALDELYAVAKLCGVAIG